MVASLLLPVAAGGKQERVTLTVEPRATTTTRHERATFTNRSRVSVQVPTLPLCIHHRRALCGRKPAPFDTRLVHFRVPLIEQVSSWVSSTHR